MATVFAIIAFILLLGSFFTVWYVWTITIEMEEDGTHVTGDIDFEMDLEEATMKMKVEGSGNGQHISESQTDSYDWEDSENSEVADVYEGTRTIMIGAVILGLLTMIFVIIAGVAGGRNPMVRKLPIILGILTVIVTLIAAGYFMAAHPKAWKDEVSSSGSDSDPMVAFMFGNGPHKSFYGEDSGVLDMEGTPVDATSEWHPDIGWYLTFVSALFFLIAIALHRHAINEDDFTESMERKKYQETSPGPSPTYAGSGPPGYGQGYQPSYRDPYTASTYGEPRRAPTVEAVEDVFDISPPPVADHSCETCGKDTRYIEQYDRWWCDSCYKYI